MAKAAALPPFPTGPGTEARRRVRAFVVPSTLQYGGQKSAFRAHSGIFPKEHAKSGCLSCRQASPLERFSTTLNRHCEERSDEAIQGIVERPTFCWIASLRSQ